MSERFLEIPRRLLVVRNFVKREFCLRLCAHASSASRSRARVALGTRSAVDVRFRSASRLTLPVHERSALRRRLLSLLPRLKKCFGPHLTTLQRVQVLSYRKGDFYSRHTDSGNESATPSFIKRRKVSLVLFINSGGSQDGRRDYSGGHLNLYGVRNGGEGVKVTGEPGLLVAFPSSTLHEVRPVRSGERLTAVTWVI